MSFDNQAEYYVDPIPSFRFLQHKYNFVQNPNRRIVWRQYSGHSFFCSCDSAVAIFGTQELQANMDYCYVRRRAECTSLGPGLNHLQAYAQTLVWPRRDVPRRFTRFFCSNKKASEPSTMIDCSLLLLCALSSYDTDPRKTRAGCACLLGRYVRARVARQLL